MLAQQGALNNDMPLVAARKGGCFAAPHQCGGEQAATLHTHWPAHGTRAAAAAGRTALGREEVAPGRDRGHERLQFFVRTEDGKTLTFRLSPDCTAEELSGHIRERTGRHVEGTWLAICGKQMQGSRSLADYGVQSCATLQQHGRLRGGMSSGGGPWRKYVAAPAGPGTDPVGGARTGDRPRWPAATLHGTGSQVAVSATRAPKPTTDPWQEP